MIAPFSRFNNWGLLLLRLAVGVPFIVHGLMKWGMWSAPPPGMSSGMVNLFRFLSIVEPLGGAAVILGFLTPLAALGLSLIMLGAIWFKMSGGVGYVGAQGTGWEFDLALLGGNAVLATMGAGRIAMDAMMRRKA